MAYNSPEEYLSAVQKQIRWKRAQKVVLEELRQHIDDQVDTFISQGMNRQEAIQHAIVQMGDPVTVGLELDRIHRPKTDFGLVFLTIGLITIGILSSFLMNSSLFSVQKIIGFCLGACLARIAEILRKSRKAFTYADFRHFIKTQKCVEFAFDHSLSHFYAKT